MRYGVLKNHYKSEVNFLRKHIKNCLLFLFMFFVIIFSTNTFAQSMKLVIGKYECTRNSDCGNGYCDIASHKCTVCSGGNSGGNTGGDSGGDSGGNSGGNGDNTCVSVADCKVGWSVVNNVCKECTSNDECTGDKPQCVSNQCIACPTDKPVWNGKYCDCSDGEINLDGTCMGCASSENCPTNKPYCNPVSHRCETCPTDKPRWLKDHCDCAEGYYSVNGECLKLRECFSNKNCSMPKPVCDLDNGLCNACPTTTPIWDGEKCVQCLSNVDCKEYGHTPVCDLTDNRCKSCANLDSTKPHFFNNKCVECGSNAHCAERADRKTICQSNTCVCPTGQYLVDGVCMGCEQDGLLIIGGNETCPSTGIHSGTINNGWWCGFSRKNARTGIVDAEGLFIADESKVYTFGRLHEGTVKYGEVRYVYLDIDGNRVLTTDGRGANSVDVYLTEGAHKIRYQARVYKRTGIMFNSQGKVCYPCPKGKLMYNGQCVSL